MAEKIADVIADLEKARNYEGPSAPGWPGLRQAGLSQGAEIVLEKLRSHDASGGLRRAYRQTPTEMELVDVLSDREIASRGYRPTDAEPRRVRGESAAARDVIQEHTTENDLYEDLWIGERLDP